MSSTSVPPFGLVELLSASPNEERVASPAEAPALIGVDPALLWISLLGGCKEVREIFNKKRT